MEVQTQKAELLDLAPFLNALEDRVLDLHIERLRGVTSADYEQCEVNRIREETKKAVEDSFTDAFRAGYEVGHAEGFTEGEAWAKRIEMGR